MLYGKLEPHKPEDSSQCWLYPDNAMFPGVSDPQVLLFSILARSILGKAFYHDLTALGGKEWVPGKFPSIYNTILLSTDFVNEKNKKSWWEMGQSIGIIHQVQELQEEELRNYS